MNMPFCQVGYVDKAGLRKMTTTKSKARAVPRQPPETKAVETAIFTIVSRNYISYAATLMQPVAAHHPMCERYVFLADEAYDFSDLDLPATVVTTDSIGIPEFSEMAFRYSVIEL